jgi:FtsP/CotA-like multicopper oxidase with cupredoxin domain
MISDTTLDRRGNIPAVPEVERMMGREGALILVNGQSNPQFSARPGERERWRIVNACVARYLRLRLDGQNLQLLGMDSGRFQEPEPVEELLLLPGNRADFLVTTAPGESVLRTFYQDRGTMQAMKGPRFGPLGPAEQPDGAALATLRVSGEPAAP